MKKEERKLIEEKLQELDLYIPHVKNEFERLVLLNDKRKLYESIGRVLEEDDLAGILINRLSAYLASPPSGGISEEEKTQLDKMLRQNYIVRGRRHIDEFWIAMEYDRDISKSFYLPRRRVLSPIIKAQQELVDGELDLLAISQPKRTGKTTTGAGLIAHLAGRDTYKGILASGAGTALVNSFYRGITEFVTSEEYTYKEIFPEAKVVNTSAEYMMMDLGTVKRFPSITCRSIDGAIVGNTEASSLLYLDDCVEGFEEARNYDRLDKKWETIRGDVLGRRIEGCPIVICGTRYSVKDPIGRLIETAEKVGWRYKVLEVPALDENDNSNWDFEKDLPPALQGKIKGSFSSQYYINEREVVSRETWESEFQQQPYEAKGLLFHEEEMNWYDELPAEEPDGVIMVVDVAGDGSDSTSAPVGKIYGKQVYIDDWFFDNSESSKTKPRLARFIIENKPSKTRFESNNGGKEYGVNVKKEIDDILPGNHLPFEYKTTSSNKQTKIWTEADVIKNYFWFNKKKYGKKGSDYYKAMTEMFTYVSDGKNKHDRG